MGDKKMRAIAAGTALAIALGTAAVATAADDDPVPYLPEPTGRHAVGSTSLYLKDTSRPDTWVPSVPYRELMVTLFYPAVRGDGPTARYLTPEESAALLEPEDIGDLPPEVLSTTRTNAVQDAVPIGRPHSLPLVVLSPGYTKPRATLSALAEDLASHGYAVALVGHTYENTGTSFPDGRFAGCASCEVTHDEAFWAKLGHGRAADVSFVVDELTGPHPAWRGARLIDRKRIAMGGHSAGGGSATTALATDSRFRAGFDIDGATHVPLTEELSRPFLFLGKYPPGAPYPRCADPSWEPDWQWLTGWKRWLQVVGAQHASFTDVGLFADQFGLDLGADVGSARVQSITRAYVGAFLDQSLRGVPSPLLEQASADYPEVAFCR
jgi:platelet-activating factor acetylhydrolase isoform II